VPKGVTACEKVLEGAIGVGDGGVLSKRISQSRVMPDRCGAQNVGLLKPTCNASRRVILVCPVTARESGNLSSVPVFPVCENRSLPAGLFHRVVKAPRSAHQPEHEERSDPGQGDQTEREERKTGSPDLSDHFKTGQWLSLQNRPTELAV
jgi:hypothetical protein